MFRNIERFKGIVELLFSDEVDIYRYENSTNEDGTTDITLPSTPLHSNVKCNISHPKIESPADFAIDNTPVQNVFKIFCSVETDIIAGDYVVAAKLSSDATINTLAGVAGSPAVYLTHKEVLCFIKESA